MNFWIRKILIKINIVKYSVNTLQIINNEYEFKHFQPVVVITLKKILV